MGGDRSPEERQGEMENPKASPLDKGSIGHPRHIVKAILRA